MASLGQADRTISTRAEGIYVWDEAGRRLIDGPGGMWCAQIGYGRRDMAEAIAEQVMKLSYHSPWNTAGERSEEHTSELQSLMRSSYAVFCLKKKKNITENTH